MLFSYERPAYSVELLPESLHLIFLQSVLGDTLIHLTSKDLEKVKSKKKEFCIMLSDFRTSFALSFFW
jgi:hypothetical protein